MIIKNQNTTYHNVWDALKECIVGNFKYVMHVLKKMKDLKLSFHFEKVGEGQFNPMQVEESKYKSVKLKVRHIFSNLSQYNEVSHGCETGTKRVRHVIFL